MTGLSAGFIPLFLEAFLTNLWVGAAALALGTVTGGPLALLRHGVPVAGRAAGAITALMRVSPAFVVMFFLLNVMPADVRIAGARVLMPPSVILILALGVHAAAHISDNFLETLRHRHDSPHAAALRIVPDMMRLFIVLVLLSTIGAAIGVPEAVTATLRQTNLIPGTVGRSLLVTAVILFFASFNQAAQFASRLLTRFLEAYWSSTGALSGRPPEGLTLGDIARMPAMFGWVAGLVAILAVLATVMAPLPPKEVTIESGPRTGSWYPIAVKYKEFLESRGIGVKIRPRDDTMEIANDVNQFDSGVDIGFAVRELKPTMVPNISSLGGIDYQPVFVFYRRAKGTLAGPAGLRGLRVVLGSKGSITATTAASLLRAYGINESNTTLSFAPLADAAAQLRAGTVDAAFFMQAAEHPAVAGMMRDPALSPLNFPHATAISRDFPVLRGVVLPAGTYDLEKEIPPHDLLLPAGMTEIIVRKTLHPAVVFQLLEAMKDIHHGATMVSREEEFPTPRTANLPLKAEAKDFYRTGLPWAFRYLPLWMASIIWYYGALIVPLVLVVPVYGWLGLPNGPQLLLRIRLLLSAHTLHRFSQQLANGLTLSRSDIVTLHLIQSFLSREDPSKRCRQLLSSVEEQLRGPGTIDRPEG